MARRWNGWGDPAIAADVTAHAHGLLATLVGPGTRPDDADLDAVVGSIPDSRLAAERGLSVDGEDRVRHARGQSLPDWVALRSGRLGPVPDAIARPIGTADVRALLDRARREGWE
ncbi:MAG: FAD-binding oxidoreductase, partial [Chloroflexota bacterium]|nr:FAD-binding oxidoreductase [Chloroflexota bacterium]